MSQNTQRSSSLSTPPAFCFIVDSSARPMSIRDKQSEQSKARSHMSLVAHKKRIDRVQRTDVVSGRNKKRATASRPDSVVFSQRQDLFSQALVPLKDSPGSRYTSPDNTCPLCFRQGAYCVYHELCTAKNRLHPSMERTSSPHPGFGCFRDEQFHGIIDGSNHNVRSLFDFQFQVINPAHNLFTEVFDITNVYAFFVPLLRFPLSYHAALALVGFVRARINPGSSSQTSFDLLHHRGQAIRLVRQYLSRPGWQETSQNQGLVSGIISLAYLEYAMGQPENARHHLQGLTRITDELGSDQNLALIDSCPEQVFVSLFRSVFAMVGWEHHDAGQWQPIYPSLTQLRTVLGKIPPGLYNLATEGKICSRTLQILVRAVSVEIERHDEAKLRARASRNRTLRTYGNVFDACPILRARDNTRAILLDKMVCFALILLSSSGSHAVMYSTMCFRPSRAELTSRLRTFQPQTNAEWDCMLWLFLVTMTSHRVTNSETVLTGEGMELFQGFYAVFSQLIQRKDWNDVEKILLQFFWTTELSRYWRHVWIELISSVHMTENSRVRREDEL